MVKEHKEVKNCAQRKYFERAEKREREYIFSLETLRLLNYLIWVMSYFSSTFNNSSNKITIASDLICFLDLHFSE